MTRRRRLIHTALLFLLPVIVAAWGLGPVSAVLLVLAMLAWRWLIVLSGIRAPEKGVAVTLDVIPPSHFVEKVRWCLDRLGVDYEERTSAATLGVFFTGRTVPRLRVRTGIVETSIGNSPEILRYLWGAWYAEAGAAAAFLEPLPARVRLEQDLDRYGRNLQVWIYSHILADAELTVRAWGGTGAAVPAWQRWLLRALFPLLAVLIRRAFRIDAQQAVKATSRIEELLGQVETRLADGRRSILGDGEINYTDIAFSAFTGLWLQPEGYAAGKADDCRIEYERMPAGMRADVDRWREDHPKATAFAESMYAAERQP